MRGSLRLHRVLFLSSLALLSACIGTGPEQTEGVGGGDSSDGSNGNVPKTIATIGPNGGAIETPSGVTITVPEGALSKDTTISITDSEAIYDAARGKAFLFEPEGLTFSAPVTIRVPYSAAALPEDTIEDVQLYVAPGETSNFELIADSTYDAAAGYVEGLTTHFSSYVAGAASGSKFVQNQGYPGAIAADATHIYWTNHGDADHPATGDYGMVMKAPIAGGAVSVVAEDQADPKGIAVDANYIYWANGGSNGVDAGIYRVSLAGGTPTKLADATFPIEIAVDSSNLYFTDAAANTVSKLNLSTKVVTTLASSQDAPYALAIDATNVYWTNKTGNTIMKVAIAGSTVTTLASTQSEPVDIAVDSTYVYWVNRGNGKVRRVAIAGGTVTTLRSLEKPAGITISAGYYYVTDWHYGAVFRYPTAGGTGYSHASSQSIPLAPVVSGDYVYWASNGGPDNTGWIGRAAK